MLKDSDTDPSGSKARPWQGIVSAVAVVVATIAAALSAWAALQTVRQFQETQLLSKRVEACFEIDRQAAAEVSGALARVRDAARRQAQMAFSITGYDLGFYGAGYTDYALSPCRGTEAEKAECEARWARAEQRYEELTEVAVRAESVTGAVQFESARTFGLLGPANVAEHERTLSARLEELRESGHSPLAAENTQLIDAAVAAQGQFRDACRESVGAYRTR